MFARRLRQLRLEKELTLREFAARFGLNYTTLCKYENGQREPDIATLERLCDFFGVSLDYLLGRSPARGQEDTVIVYREPGEELPPAALEELERFVEYLRHKYTAEDAKNGKL